MAESVREKVLKNTLPKILNENSINMECAVCLQACIHPAKLPCGHIFCYLCIKGIVNQGRRCAMCRQDIPIDYLDKPRLLKPVDVDNSNPGFDDGHLWFYEGHNGWWQYDERTSVELESAYQKGERCCELLIAGFLYIADFDAMLQYRRNDPSRRRRIKRDLATTSKKGVAGLKPTKQCNIASLSLSDLTTNEPRQNLPTSEESIMNNLRNGFSSLSLSDVSSNNSEQLQNEQRLSNRNLFLTSSTSHLNSQSNSQNNIISDSQIESNASFSNRNLDLDSVMNHSIDLSIEEIESLNLELLNDYEVLFRDVNNYDNVNLDRNRSASVTINSSSILQNSRNRLQDENNLGSTERTQNFSRSEGNVSSSSTSRNLVNETNFSCSVRNSLSETPQSSSSVMPAPQPPSRSRGTSRIRPKLMSLCQLPKKSEM